MTNMSDGDDIIDEQLAKHSNVKNTTEVDEETKKQIDDKLLEHYKNAEHVSIVPLLKLIYLTNGIDLSDKYKLKYSLTSSNIDKLNAGELVLSNGIKKIKISLGIVEPGYDLLESINNKKLFSSDIDTLCVPEDDKSDDNDTKLKKTIVSAISFLTQACLVCFNMIKDNNKDLLEYNLTLDHNTTIYLEHSLNKRIGIVFN